LGYEELWVNDTRRGDGLRTLAAMAAETLTLPFGLGVVALSEQEPAAIVGRVAAAEIPSARLTVGVGSGASRSLDLVRSGVAALRALLPDHAIAVAAVGPRMARLAGEVADAVVANWALPDRLLQLRAIVAEGAAAANRPTPRVVAYVRTALGPGAEGRLRDDMERYAAYAPHYARAFADQPDALVGIALESGERQAVLEALEPYRAVAETVVVRAIPDGDAVDAWLEVARTAAPR
jgi:alkanesulfonate monooxygenase SsuD/methylene tetrahydromethanopterin reductase-like flavin-dependent oxidoreductase (luciferase family)